MSEQNIYMDTVTKWGGKAQCEMAVEECAELIVALKGYDRGRATEEQVQEEVADVIIMMEQMRYLWGSKQVDTIKARKLSRLHGRVYGNDDPGMGSLVA